MFTVAHTPTTEIKATALTLVEGGWLTPDMYQARKGNLTACIADAVAHVALTARPRPLTSLDAVVADSAEQAEIEHSSSRNDEYNSRKKVKAGKVNVIVVNARGLPKCTHRVIGPRIQALETFHPGLGATVMWWLHAALDKSARACDPISGLGWAQGNYWQGEDDETYVCDEQLEEARSYHESGQEDLPADKRTPFNEAAARRDLGIFRRAEYDKKIPKWVSSLRGPKLSIPKLEHIRQSRRWTKSQPAKRLTDIFAGTPDLITATIAAAQLTAAAPHCSQTHDLGCFEYMRWEICPFLLRWERGPLDPKKDVGDWVQDHLGMIWDDCLNREYEGGETNMNAIAAWGWHDAPSLINAMKRFERWCRLLQAAETLLDLIQPAEIKQ